MGSFDKYRFRFSLAQPLSLISEEVAEERRKQIMLMGEELALYNVLIKDLVSECPSSDIRNQSLSIAKYIISDTEIYDRIIEDRELPISKIMKKIPIAKSFLELWQDYIIVYIVILGNPNYKYIQDYLRIEESVDILVGKGLIEDKSETIIKGITLSKSRNKAIILTSKGEFKKINIRESIEIGEEVSGEISRRLIDYKLHISIISILIIMMIAVIGIKYSTITKTIVINTTSLIKVEVNSFGRVINAQSPTTKGTEMLEKIKIRDSYMDEAIYEIFKYALENEMIPNDDVLITVSGKMIDLETISKTRKLLEDNEIRVKFNNSGNEYYINQ